MFDAGLKDAQTRIEAGFEAWRRTAPDLPVTDAMRYALRGGKRLRGYLAMESARLHGVPDALNPALAIEAIHAYSLVHDDLPGVAQVERHGQGTQLL